jgi:methylmalonyl-CoA mutase N-terminal domain/subunit
MWARIMKERFHAINPESMKLRFHAQTGGSTLTAQQIDNNVVRVTVQALAAVLGGCQSLHTNSRDEALALPTEEAARLALRTQQIIANETGVTDSVDPLGGSYLVEQLTDEIELKANEYLQKIEKLGGAVNAIRQQFYQTEISDSAYRYQQAIETKEKIIVGVNELTSKEGAQPLLLTIDPTVREKQIERIKRLKSKRNQPVVSAALNRLQDSAKGNENLIPKILDCVESYATLGEISDALRSVWGEYT